MNFKKYLMDFRNVEKVFIILEIIEEKLVCTILKEFTFGSVLQSFFV